MVKKFQFSKTKIFPPDSLSPSKDLDLAWSILFGSFNDIPMWTGWNTQRAIDDHQHQVVTYMKPIMLPPTRNDVVQETLDRSIKVSEECGEKHTIVTYDLAIAKKGQANTIGRSPKI